ncbi:hypothetical protein MUDAN_DOGOELCO_00623 [Lactiplantibacillus mudanjiangensis]|uniref:hypothetical protein n=1 Tax=Lactiplantibacillus mudanjiangensis TaxID=1296538 RepID=UPI0010150674|nr:hypothetical protein [Lactiplantibacillus mudanjiangensis]VDG31122.1 hypothetical protein MUDAN_DOGOELCO_00623 [Lactiplantibacillus mudanjiangensis]
MATKKFYFDYIKATVRLNTIKKLKFEMQDILISLDDVDEKSDFEDQIWLAICVTYQEWVTGLSAELLKGNSFLTQLFQMNDRTNLPADTVIDVLPGFGEYQERLKVFSLITDLGSHAETNSYFVNVSVRHFNGMPTELQKKAHATVTYELKF